jgi:O-antigen ligase
MAARALQFALLLLVVGNLGRIPVLESGGKQAPLLINDFAVFAVLIVASVEAMQARVLRVDWIGGVALLFAVVGAVSAVLAVPKFSLSGFELVFSLAYLARWLVYFSLYVVAINLVTRADIPRLLAAFDTSALLFAAFGCFQAAFLPGFAQLVYPDSVQYADWDPQGHRLVSTFLDPNYAGALLVIALLVTAGRIASGERISAWKPSLLLAALLLTLSRSSFLALAVGALVVLFARGVSARLMKIAAFVALLTIPFIPSLLRFAAGFNKLGVDASALQRLVAWARALRVVADNAIIGVGFNTYGYVGRFYGFDATGTSAFALDGGLLFIAVMTGVVGVLLYVGMLALIVWRCRSVWVDATMTSSERGTAVGIAAATVAMVVHSLFVNSLLLPFLMEPLWILWAVPFILRAPIRAAVSARGARSIVSFASPA